MQRPHLLAAALCALAFAAPATRAQTCLTTLFAADTGGNARGVVFFDITVTNPIQVTGFTTNYNTTASNVGLTVWMTPGGYAGNELNLSVWRQVGEGDGTAIGAGQDNPTTIDLVAPFRLAPGTYGMALIAAGPAGHSYTRGTGSNQNYSDADIALSLGTAQNTPWTGGVFPTRVWNGSICYCSCVVINEFSYDDSSTDDHEYVELYNPSGASVDIGNWVLASEDQNGPNTSYTIPSGTTMASGGFYVMGSALVPNVDQVLGTTNLWENDQEQITLRNSTGQVIDNVIYEVNKGLWPTAMADGDQIWGDFIGVQQANVYTAFMLGRNEVPPVTSRAYSRAVARFDPATRNVSIVACDCPPPPIVCTYTAMHAHLAPAGVNGPVVVTLTKGLDNLWTGSKVLTAAEATALASGGMYVNAHTAANPGGENRGQLTNFPTRAIGDDDGVNTSAMAIGDDDAVFASIASSPGMPNDAGRQDLPYASNYDAAAAETYLREFPGSFEDGVTIDPTVVSAHNPNAIPASPQGGNAAIFWDPIGGGNACTMAHNLGSSRNRGLVFDALVYFDATLKPTGEYETWSIGVGSTGSLYNTPDPGGALGLTANGNTGFSWTYQVTDTSATLYFIDHNDGGWGPTAMTDATIVVQVPIRPGINDGWQRLYFAIGDDDAVHTRACACEHFLASFGGQRGGGGASVYADGCHNSARSNRSSIYVAYRENLSNNTTGRPPTVDDMDVHELTAAVNFFSTSKGHNFGTPSIDVNSPPVLGNAVFAVTASGLVPLQTTFVMLGATRQPPFDLGLIGGQPGSLLVVQALLTLPVGTDGNGDARLPIGIPSDLAFLGASLYWQVFDADFTLAIPLPLGNSMGMETKLGN